MSINENVFIPVTIESINDNNIIVGVEFMIDFDSDVIQWKGTSQNPTLGATNFNPLFS